MNTRNASSENNRVDVIAKEIRVRNDWVYVVALKVDAAGPAVRSSYANSYRR
jgi:hypothetical protein